MRRNGATNHKKNGGKLSQTDHPRHTRKIKGPGIDHIRLRRSDERKYQTNKAVKNMRCQACYQSRLHSLLQISAVPKKTCSRSDYGKRHSQHAKRTQQKNSANAIGIHRWRYHAKGGNEETLGFENRCLPLRTGSSVRQRSS
jgi:hypothetical protein